MNLDMRDEPSKLPTRLFSVNKKTLILVGLAIGLAAVIITFVAMLMAGSVQVPAEVSQKFKSAVYVPSKLPGKYRVDPSSFSLAEGDTVLLFAAKDGVNADLVFSEQPRPKDFNFDDFHKNQMTESKTLNDVPFSSVWGKGAGDRLVLSVVTNDTWILVTTAAALNGDDMARVAAGITKH